MENNEIKTGKGWHQLIKENKIPKQPPITLEYIQKILKDVFETHNAIENPHTVYWKNIIESWSPTAIEIFNKYLKKEVENLPFKLKTK